MDTAEPPRDRVAAWLDWIGVGRLVAAAASIVVVVAGGFWLLRSPPPATEASLPQATTTTVAGGGAGDGGGAGVGDDGAGGRGASASSSAPPSTVAPDVIVHVTGAVVSPGVYELPATSRVRAAVEAAGGMIADADESALNLAAPVIDGSRIRVPRVGEQGDRSEAGDVAPIELPPSSGTDGSGAAPGALIDVNRASGPQLEELPGIGPALAAAIVDEREANGPFLGIDDLERVPGIGPAKLGALRDLVVA